MTPPTLYPHEVIIEWIASRILLITTVATFVGLFGFVYIASELLVLNVGPQTILPSPLIMAVGILLLIAGIVLVWWTE